MREVRDVRYSFAELNGRLGTSHDREHFAFVVRRAGLKDVTTESDALVAPSYVPLEMMLRESLAALATEGVRPAPCESCKRVFDPDREEGIFREPAGFVGFVCRNCAEKMSAWTYFQEWFRG